LSRRHRRNSPSRATSLLLVGMAAVVLADVAMADLAATSAPRPTLSRRIRTRPFANKNVWMKDSEGSAYVPRNRSIWLSDDNARAVYEVNAITGGLKRMIGRAQFENARRAGGGPRAGADRTRDFESMAYDRTHDALYVFSGPCCAPSVLPTVFRLKRNAGGVFHVASYRILPRNADFNGAAWNPASGKIVVAHDEDFRTYDFTKNRLGGIFHVRNLVGVSGMGFSPDGASLFVTTDEERLRRVKWRTKRLFQGWNFDLTRFGIRDSRAVELINGRLYVSDGADSRANTDPFKYAVYVIRLN
jgi:hypothetical protein